MSIITRIKQVKQHVTDWFKHIKSAFICTHTNTNTIDEMNEVLDMSSEVATL